MLRYPFTLLLCISLCTLDHICYIALKGIFRRFKRLSPLYSIIPLPYLLSSIRINLAF